MSLIKDQLEKTADLVNKSLLSIVEKDNYEILSAIRYSCIPAGKCIRAFLTLEFAKICNINHQDSLLLASIIELIHAFSLVHDDLPALDNSDTRRKRDACHIKFRESTAILAGDAILTIAYRLLGMHFPALLQVTSEAVLEMIKGQSLEITNKEEISWQKISKMKTGEIFALACTFCLLASNFDAKKITTAKEFGYKFGLLFQLADDIKDGDKRSEEKYNLRVLLKEANLLLENPLFKACQKNLSDLMLYVCNNL